MSSLGLVPRRSLPVATRLCPQGPLHSLSAPSRPLCSWTCTPQLTPAHVVSGAPRAGRGAVWEPLCPSVKACRYPHRGLQVARNSWARAATAGGRGRKVATGKPRGSQTTSCRPHGLSGWGGHRGVGVSADSLGAASSILRGCLRKIKWTMKYD